MVYCLKIGVDAGRGCDTQTMQGGQEGWMFGIHGRQPLLKSYKHKEVV